MFQIIQNECDKNDFCSLLPNILTNELRNILSKDKKPVESMDEINEIITKLNSKMFEKYDFERPESQFNDQCPIHNLLIDQMISK